MFRKVQLTYQSQLVTFYFDPQVFNTLIPVPENKAAEEVILRKFCAAAVANSKLTNLSVENQYYVYRIRKNRVFDNGVEIKRYSFGAVLINLTRKLPASGFAIDPVPGFAIDPVDEQLQNEALITDLNTKASTFLSDNLSASVINSAVNFAKKFEEQNKTDFYSGKFKLPEAAAKPPEHKDLLEAYDPKKAANLFKTPTEEIQKKLKSSKNRFERLKKSIPWQQNIAVRKDLQTYADTLIKSSSNNLYSQTQALINQVENDIRSLEQSSTEERVISQFNLYQKASAASKLLRMHLAYEIYTAARERCEKIKKDALAKYPTKNSIVVINAVKTSSSNVVNASETSSPTLPKKGKNFNLVGKIAPSLNKAKQLKQTLTETAASKLHKNRNEMLALRKEFIQRQQLNFNKSFKLAGIELNDYGQLLPITTGNSSRAGKSAFQALSELLLDTKDDDLHILIRNLLDACNYEKTTQSDELVSVRQALDRFNLSCQKTFSSYSPNIDASTPFFSYFTAAGYESKTEFQWNQNAENLKKALKADLLLPIQTVSDSTAKQLIILNGIESQLIEMQALIDNSIEVFAELKVKIDAYRNFLNRTSSIVSNENEMIKTAFLNTQGILMLQKAAEQFFEKINKLENGDFELIKSNMKLITTHFEKITASTSNLTATLRNLQTSQKDLFATTDAQAGIEKAEAHFALVKENSENVSSAMALVLHYQELMKVLNDISYVPKLIEMKNLNLAGLSLDENNPDVQAILDAQSKINVLKDNMLGIFKLLMDQQLKLSEELQNPNLNKLVQSHLLVSLQENYRAIQESGDAADNIAREVEDKIFQLREEQMAAKEQKEEEKVSTEEIKEIVFKNEMAFKKVEPITLPAEPELPASASPPVTVSEKINSSLPSQQSIPSQEEVKKPTVETSEIPAVSPAIPTNIPIKKDPVNFLKRHLGKFLTTGVSGVIGFVLGALVLGFLAPFTFGTSLIVGAVFGTIGFGVLGFSISMTVGKIKEHHTSKLDEPVKFSGSHAAAQKQLSEQKIKRNPWKQQRKRGSSRPASERPGPDSKRRSRLEWEGFYTPPNPVNPPSIDTKKGDNKKRKGPK